MTNSRLDPTSLFTPCSAESLEFETTDDLPDLEEIIGQERALEAIRFGVGIRRKGFNLYALGASGSAHRSVVRKLISEKASTEPVPDDQCYVYHFAEPNKPSALALPAGMGSKLRHDMTQLVEEIGSVVPLALESDEYRARHQELEEVFRERQDKAFGELQKKADAQDIRFLRTPAGFAFAPTRTGEVIEPDDYQKLSEDERKVIERRVNELQAELDRLIRQVPKWRREMQQQVKALNRAVIMSVVGQLMTEIRRRFDALPPVVEYLNAVETDIVEHADQFGHTEDAPSGLAELFKSDGEKRAPFLNRYQVNLIVDNNEVEGAPVVYLDNPSFPNLVGRVEHQAQLGALVTDFTMIKPGGLHQANGGYLILDAQKLLTQPYAYDGLKRALQSQQVAIESLAQVFSVVSTVSLEPERVPLDMKVVLIGDRRVYYLLCEYDEQFGELFKVAADFDEVMERSLEGTKQYAALLATFARREKLRPMDASAVGRVIEHASRMIADSEKLSTRFGKVADLLREADHLTGQAGRDLMTADDVQRAINARERRYSRIRERVLEATLRGSLMIETRGAEVGQVNALSVLTLGDQAFGHPSRVTSRVRLGKGEVVDIEREVELGGPIHSKGVLILAGYLAGQYCPDQPLSLRASLVFEQNYSGVEGDSASAAELFALISALSGVPLSQSFAVTGSINQLGRIQPIGGVNEKIEGFFDLCDKRGLTGEQGVIIPRTNVMHLMLRSDVVDAVAREAFHIHAIETVDEGLSLLSGIPAGERHENGKFPEGSLNQRVETRLSALARAANKRARDGATESSE